MAFRGNFRADAAFAIFAIVCSYVTSTAALSSAGGKSSEEHESSRLGSRRSVTASGVDESPRAQESSGNRPPHIVFVLSDDLGFADVGWNDPSTRPFATSQAELTPTLTKLAHEGIILENAYSLHMCSPSRAAFLTGRHPIAYGMQDAILRPDRAYGLPLDQPLLSESLQELGYRTAIVGEWHLGFCNASYMPTSRGFHSFFGPVTGRMDYFNHTYRWRPKYSKPSYVLHNNTEPISTNKAYSTFLFANWTRRLISAHRPDEPLFLFLPLTAPHTPVQAPIEFHRQAARLLPRASSKRRGYAAVLLALDYAVGTVVDALRMRGMWENTVFVFTSDNGPSPRYGDSYPLRGAKGTIFEGGMRVPAFIRGNMFPRQGYRENIIVHIADWYPTLVSLAGGKHSFANNVIDGVDFSRRLLAARGETALAPIRREMLYFLKVRPKRERCKAACCPSRLVTGAYRLGDLKVVAVNSENALLKGRWHYKGQPTWTPPRHRVAWHYRDYARLMKQSDGNYWGLFHLTSDPFEQVNLIRYRPVYFNFLRRKLLSFCSLGQKASLWDVHKDLPVSEANPKYYNNFWTHGWC